MKGYWQWGSSLTLDCRVMGLAVWWTREYDRGLVVYLILGPWYLGYRWWGNDA